MKCFCDQEPAQVGGDVGEGVGVGAGPGGQQLGGQAPGEAAQAQVVGQGEDLQRGQHQPGPGLPGRGVQRAVAAVPGVRLLLAHCAGEVEAGGEHGEAHAGLGHQQQRPPAHQLPHHEAEERGQEVGQAQDQGAVLGWQTQPGLLCRRMTQ